MVLFPLLLMFAPARFCCCCCCCRCSSCSCCCSCCALITISSFSFCALALSSFSLCSLCCLIDTNPLPASQKLPLRVCDISFSLDISRDFNSANPALNLDVVVFEPPLPAFGTNENNSKLFPPGGVAPTSRSSFFFFFFVARKAAASSFWYGSEYTKQLVSFSSPPLVFVLVVVAIGLLGTGVIFTKEESSRYFFCRLYM